MPKVLEFPEIPIHELDAEATRLHYLRKAESTEDGWKGKRGIFERFCRTYRLDFHDSRTLNNEPWFIRYVCYRFKVDDVGSSCARGDCYAIRFIISIR